MHALVIRNSQSFPKHTLDVVYDIKASAAQSQSGVDVKEKKSVRPEDFLKKGSASCSSMQG